MNPSRLQWFALFFSLLLVRDAVAQNDLFVTNGQTNVISSGTNAYPGSTVLGNAFGDSNNVLEVENTGTVLSNGAFVFVGASGSDNRLTISNGATVQTDQGSVIGSAMFSTNNTVLVTGSNSSWVNSANLTVGSFGSGNSLTIEGGATVTNNNDGAIGFETTSSNNSALVTGAGSAWTNGANLVVGNSGSGNSLVISNGGHVANEFGTLSFFSASSNNSVTVTDAGSRWLNSSNLVVGNGGSGNSLVISNGAEVLSGDGIIGFTNTASNNRATVTGAGSQWINSEDFTVGYGGSGNSLEIADGATNLVASNSYIGFNLSSSHNTVLVTGPGSVWTNAGALSIGHDGGGNSLVISNEGQVANSFGAFVGATGSDNHVLVTDSNSRWTVTGGLLVGDGGSGNSLVISNAARVAATDSLVGNATNSSNNAVFVTGAYSILTNTFDLRVGVSGSGNSLVISNGGAAANDFGTIGDEAESSNNSVTVTDAGSRWLNSSNLVVGNGGSGNSLVISNGAEVLSGDGIIGFNDTASHNRATVAGPDSQWASGGHFYVGLNGSGNSLIVSAGATNLVAGDSYIGYGSISSNNSVLVTDAGSFWTNAGALVVGSDGSSNRLVISNGANVAAATGGLGATTNSSDNSALLTGAGSRWINSGDFAVGYGGSGNSMVVSDGATNLVSGTSVIGFTNTSTNNTVLVTGAGSVWTNTGNLTVGQNGNGNSLVISNGGRVEGFRGYIGFGTNSSNNTVLVTGTNSNGISTWANGDDLYVGYDGSGNSMRIEGGASVASTFGYIGFGTNSSDNFAVVTGARSTWSNSGDFIVGYNGSSNSLIVSDGGNVSGANSYVGDKLESSNNSVLVSGADSSGRASTWTSAGFLYVGHIGSSSRMVISNGGAVTSAEGRIGFETSSSNNSVLVTGAGSAFTNNSSFYLGKAGGGNSLVISNGGRMESGTELFSETFVGHDSTSSGNSVLVTGSNSIWTNANRMVIGRAGANNSLTIADAGKLASSHDIALGEVAGSTNNSLLVTGDGSSLSTGEITVGGGGSSNRMVVTNGAYVTNTWTYLGRGAGSDGNSLVVSGTNSRMDTFVDFNVGYNGSSNTLVVSDGAAVTHGGHHRGAALGVGAGSSNNSALVTGGNSSWTSLAGFFVGYGGSSNSLVISNGGAVSNAFGHAGGAMIGRHTNASNNTVLVTGSNSSWTSSADFFVGYAGSDNSLVITNGGRVSVTNASFVGFEQGSVGNTVMVAGTDSLWTNGAIVLGQEGSGNTLTISNDGDVAAAGASFIGNGSNATGNIAMVTGTGSSWTSGWNFWVGREGSGNSMSVLDGGFVSVGADGVVGGSIGASNNTLTIGGPLSQWTNRGSIYIGGGSNSVTVTNGGTLSVSGYTFVAPNAAEQGNSIVVTGSGSEWTSALYVYFGDRGSGNTLDVLDEGTVSLAENLIIAYYAEASNNTVTVSGSGSSLASGATIIVGREGSGNRVVVTNQGEVSAVGTVIGEQTNSTGNSVIVTGANSRWTNSDVFYVGNQGSGSTMIISDGGKVAANNTYVGYDVASAGNTVVVASAGSTWSNAGIFVLGNAGSSNTLGISNGATLTSRDSVVGAQASSSNNVVEVTGAGLRWSNTAGLVVGGSGSDNHLTISNGAIVAADRSFLGAQASSSNNSALVTGAGSSWTTAQLFYVGNDGSGNRLEIAAGGVVAAYGSLLGATGSSNSALVTGAGSRWTNSSGLYVGDAGSGNRLEIADGGSLVTGGADIGFWTNAFSNTVTVTGVDSTWTNLGALSVGNYGSSNSLVISNGGAVTSIQGRIGSQTNSSNNCVLVTGTNSNGASTWTNSGNLYVGYHGNGNSLVISNGGLAANDFGTLGNEVESSNNTVFVTGAGSVWSNTGNLTVGQNGNGNSLVISNGGLVASVFGYLSFSNPSTNNSVTVTDLGSRWLNSSNLVVGNGGSGSLVISNGGRVESAEGHLGFFQESSGNTVTVTGDGSAWINSSTLSVGLSGSGNRLVISDGGLVQNSRGAIGETFVSSGNSVLVTGTNLSGARSSWSNSGFVTVGSLGSDNSLVISNGAAVFSANGLVGSDSDSSNNTVSVAGTGSEWTNTGFVYVGFFGSGNLLEITNGGAVSASYMTAGRAVGANNNQVTVGANSRISVVDKFDVGFNGSSNSLVITNGGQVLLGSGGSSIGSFSANGNNVLVTGPGSTLSNVGIYYVGFQGAGNRLTLSNQGQLLSDQLAVGGSVGGGSLGSNNAVLVTGNSSMGINGDLSVGREGASNSMTVSAGGAVTSVNGFIGFTSTSSNNSVLVTGLGSVWTNSGTLILGDAGVGNSLTVADGGSVSATSITIASQAGSGGTLNFGRLGQNDASGTIYAATIAFGGGTGAINFNQTNTFVLDHTVTGSGSLNQLGTGTLVLGGGLGGFTGVLSVANGTLSLTNTNSLGGTTELLMSSGGTLNVSQTGTNTLALGITVTGGTGTILNSGGGTLVLNTNLVKSGSILVLAGGDFEVNGVISGTGAPGSFNSDLVLGSSVTPGPTTVTINTPATYVGPTIIRAGSTLINGTNNALPGSTVVTLGDAATDSGSTVNRYDMQGFDQTIGGLASVGPANNVVEGDGTLTVSGPSSTVFNGVLDGAMAVVRAGTGATILGGANTYTGGTTVQSGRLVAANAAALGTGAVTLLGGTLELQSQLDIGSLLWDGAATIALPGAGAGQFLKVTGLLELTNGVNNFSVAGAALPRSPVKLLTSTNLPSLSTNDFGVLGLRSYTLSIDGDSLYLTAQDISYQSFAITPNQVNVAKALDTFIGASGDRGTVSAALDTLAISQYPAAFEQLMPSQYASLPSMAFNVANALNSSLFQRMWAVRVNGGGFSASGMNLAPMQAEMGGTDDMGVFAINPSKDARWGTFVDGNGVFANAASTGSVQNYRSQSGGVMVGASYRWSGNLSTGVYAGYQGLQAEYDSGRTIDNAVRFGVFGTYDIEDFYFNALVGGVYHGYTVNRYINFGGIDRTATGRPGAGEFDLALGTGYDFQAGDLTFGPFTTLQYTYLGVQGFTETGADSLDLDVSPYNSSSLLYTLGGQAAYNWRASSRVTVTPSIFAGWQHEFLQNGYAINSSFNTGGPAAPFAYDTSAPARDYFYGGAGVTVGVGERWTASFIYSAFAANADVSSQNLYLSIGLEF